MLNTEDPSIEYEQIYSNNIKSANIYLAINCIFLVSEYTKMFQTYGNFATRFGPCN